MDVLLVCSIYCIAPPRGGAITLFNSMFLRTGFIWVFGFISGLIPKQLSWCTPSGTLRRTYMCLIAPPRRGWGNTKINMLNRDRIRFGIRIHIRIYAKHRFSWRNPSWTLGIRLPLFVFSLKVVGGMHHLCGFKLEEVRRLWFSQMCCRTVVAEYPQDREKTRRRTVAHKYAHALAQYL